MRPRLSESCRCRIAYALAAGAIISLGLFWRSRYFGLGAFLQKYGGDALWAALVFVLLRFIRPRQPSRISTWLAFSVSVAVEISQLYHAPWIDGIRSTRLGALALGSTFNWPDIPAYAIGIAVAALADRLATRNRDSTPLPAG